jgi:uncharacterized protein YbcI
VNSLGETSGETNGELEPAPSGERGPRREGGPLPVAISNAMVGLYKRYYGRGPTKARTHVTRDTVLVVLEEVYTTVEAALIEKGDADTVNHVRRSFQRSFEREFIEEIERITGRRVRAFMSSAHVKPDIAVEVFLLDPEGDRSGSGAEGASGIV